MTDFETQKESDDITLEALPGIFIVFLKTEKNNKPYQRAVFFEAKENAWLACQRIRRYLRPTEYPELHQDIKEFTWDAFIVKVLKTSHRFDKDSVRKQALKDLELEFKEKYPKCVFYEK